VFLSDSGFEPNQCPLGPSERGRPREPAQSALKRRQIGCACRDSPGPWRRHLRQAASRFADEVSPVADAALVGFENEEALVPPIWPLEVANGLRTAQRRGRLDLADLARIPELLISLPIQVEAIDLDVALGEVSDLARSLNLTAYDVAYLALAARRALVQQVGVYEGGLTWVVSTTRADNSDARHQVEMTLSIEWLRR
jgi:hypothetical protein